MAEPWSRDPLQLLTVTEVAQRFRVKPKTVYAWVAQRKILFVKVNGALRFRRLDLEAMVRPTTDSPPAGGAVQVPQPSLAPDTVKALMTRVRKSMTKSPHDLYRVGLSATLAAVCGELASARKEGIPMGLFRRSNSPHWWISFSHSGRQYRLSTGTADRRLADKIAAKVKVEIDAERWFPGSPAQTKTVQELLDKYLKEHSARNKKPSSMKRDRGLAKHLLAAFGSLTLAQITPKLIAAYKSMRRIAGARARTVNLELAMGRHAFNLAMREWQWCSSNPFLMVNRERVPADIERWLTQEEEERLLPACTAWLRDMVLMALHTGLRLGEIRSLRWKRVDLAHRRIVVETVLSKTSRARTIPLNRTIRMMLSRRALASGQCPEALAFATTRGTVFTESNVNRAFRLAVKRAGLASIRFHDLRHTFATRLVQKGVDLYKVQRLLGHTSPTMTQRYAHHSTSSLTPAVNLLDEGDNTARLELAQN